MKRYSTSEARKALSDLIDHVAFGGERVVLTRRGMPVVALVPVDEAEVLERMDEEEADRRAVAEARAEGGVMSFEQVLAEHGIDPDQLRKAAALLE